MSVSENNPCFDLNNFRGTLVPIMNREFAKLLLDRITAGQPVEELPPPLHALAVRLQSAIDFVPTTTNRPAFDLSGFHGTIVLVANQSFAEELIDLTNIAEDAKGQLTPSVYTFGEQLDLILDNKGRSPQRKKAA